MIYQATTRLYSLPRFNRVRLGIFLAFLLLCLCFRCETILLVPEIIEQHVIHSSNGLYRIPKGEPMPSVNLVVGATSTEDYSWVKDVKIAGMKIIP